MRVLLSRVEEGTRDSCESSGEKSRGSNKRQRYCESSSEKNRGRYRRHAEDSGE